MCIFSCFCPFLYILFNFFKLLHNIFSTSKHQAARVLNYKGASAEGSRGCRECERKGAVGDKERKRKRAVGVREAERVIKYPRGLATQEFFRKSLTVPKNNHSISLYIDTNYSLYIIEWFAYLNTCIPYFFTCITYPNTLTRLSAPYLNTCTAYLNTLSRLPILIHALPILIH